MIPAGRTKRTWSDVVDIVCRHPSTARTSPPNSCGGSCLKTRPSLVEQVADVFRSTDGDIKSMVRTC